METNVKVKLYGTERCHKTRYYKTFFEARNINYVLLDVESDANHAKALRNLYESKKLNFPTITIGDKKLRNPSDSELEKWLNKKQLIKN